MSTALQHAVVLAVAAAVTHLATGGVIALAPRLGAVVAPDERHVHERPTPTGGGAAMYVGMAVALALASRLDAFHDTFAGSSEALAVVVAAGVIFGIGALDDLHDLSAPAKVAGQVLAGSLLAVLGVTLFFVRLPFGGLVVLSADWATLVTVVLVVLVANAVNLVDGLDGLAAGMVAIGACAMYLYARSLQSAGVLDDANIGPLLALITVGVCVGFLPRNMHPARVFMGDGGSLLLGLLMAASTMTISGRVAEPFSGQVYFFFAPALIPALVLGVPLIDSILAVARRAASGAGITNADKDHVHHRLMRMGHGHRRTVLLLWAWTALASSVALVPIWAGRGDAVLPFALVGAVVLLRLLIRPRRTAPAES
ncbi:MAG TPA: undecaprenyl/decaprenyl-phosphate alpha-N-acetylglucosaminyl 1-phosphate transferase [Acidimicrobiaceae bacterium]|nr:undecaprenyl/decaprenyl-phosphate alpha-N-acetylglucosaminyl 1-phosphate transferase [Acidimicrobiaceae bacterium]HCB37402.1 undecaprenyl/decaprenyl-phosphate alpha-N-acetylglucosaminyl 1-phosphate transferase [Acidimicrobiaceae bacterium]